MIINWNEVGGVIEEVHDPPEDDLTLLYAEEEWHTYQMLYMQDIHDSLTLPSTLELLR